MFAVDVFGIMYVPYNKAEHDDLFDEPEVDEVKEEMTNIDIVIDDTFDAQVGGAIEDEFAIAESEDTELAIQKALDHAKAISVRASTTMPVVDPSALASIDFSNTVDLDAPITLSNNEETSTNVRDAAKKAYHEIVEIYGTGMGDPSVLLMDESTGNEPNKSKTLSSLTSGSIIKSSAGINAIEEGDEEAAEREEIEDGVRQSLELQRLIEEKMRLESEWSKVGYIDSTDVSVYTEFDESVYSGYSGSIQKSIRPVSGTDTPLKHSMATVPDMNYRKALTYLKSVDYSPYFDLIKTQDDVTKSKNWFGFGGVKQLKFYGHEDALRLPFLIAQLNYDPYDIKHFGMLVSIYQALLGNKDYSVDLPLLGGHWEMIGFQGADPRTDLNRSMKMLSILLV